jgi:hypothetical protein
VTVLSGEPPDGVVISTRLTRQHLHRVQRKLSPAVRFSIKTRTLHKVWKGHDGGEYGEELTVIDVMLI